MQRLPLLCAGFFQFTLNILASKSAIKYTRSNSDSISYHKNIEPHLLNVSTGKSNEVITDIVQHYVRHDRATETFKKRKLEGDSLASKIKSSKRLTAGVLFSAGHVGCDEEVLELVQSKCKERNKAAGAKALKVYKSYLERKHMVEELKAQGILDVEASKQKGKNLRVLVQWYRRKNDPVLPKTIKGLQETYANTKMRPDLTAEQYLQSKDVFDKYKAETKGLELTMADLEEMNSKDCNTSKDNCDENEEPMLTAV